MKDKEEKAKEYADITWGKDDLYPREWLRCFKDFKAGFEAGKQEPCQQCREELLEREIANQLMIETLLNIARPVAYFQRKAKKENAKVDGFYVQQLANNAHILREFAENCLKTLGIDIATELENLSK